MLPGLVRRIDGLNTSISNLTMWLIIPLVGVMLYDVVMRYCFNAPTLWGAELGMMIFGVYMIYAGPVPSCKKFRWAWIFSPHASSPEPEPWSIA